MVDERLVAELQRVPWRAESVRMTAFVSPGQDLREGGWWEQVTGSAPERRVSRPRLLGYEEEGPFQGRTLALKVQPNRIDWLLVPLLGEEERDGVPTIGMLTESITFLSDRIEPWLRSAPRLQRLAFGAIAHIEVENRETAYRRLAEFLPGVRIDAERSSDLLYQVNRPRPSRGIEGLEINRLSKWSSALIQRVLISVAPRGVEEVTAPTITTCRLELDINTSPRYELELPSEMLYALFDELCDLGAEIALRGDLP